MVESDGESQKAKVDELRVSKAERARGRTIEHPTWLYRGVCETDPAAGLDWKKSRGERAHVL